MDQNGYVMTMISFLLIIPSLMLMMVFLELESSGQQSQSSILTYNNLFRASEDVESNIPTLTREVLKKQSEEIIRTGIPLTNSKNTIKNSLQDRMNDFTMKFNHEGISVNCSVVSVDNNINDPFQVEVKSIVTVKKNQRVQKRDLAQNISINSAECPIPDPMPFLKCKNYGGPRIQGNRIFYGSSLRNYMQSRGLTNTEVYENATSPLFIKKCPYDPYELHGSTKNLINLKNCIDNGYYHESRDGSCFFCKLEGKSICPHYGLETFITPPYSSNNTTASAPCSSDHVIFDDVGNGIYPGKEVQYNYNGSHYLYLFLDNGHRQKYGLPLV